MTALLALAVLLGALAGAAQGQPAAERRVPFAPGEALTFDVSWTTYVSAGTVTATVRAKRPFQGSTVYDIVAEGRPAPVVAKLYTLSYRLETLLDARTLLPLRAVAYSEEGSRRRTRTTTFDQAAGRAVYEVTIGDTTRRELQTPARVQDSLSVLYVLRALQLADGDVMTIPVVDSGRVHRLRLKAGPREPIEALGRVVPALRVTPSAVDDAKVNKNRLTLWLSEDARRLPLRADVEALVGSFRFTLRAATP